MVVSVTELRIVPNWKQFKANKLRILEGAITLQATLPTIRVVFYNYCFVVGFTVWMKFYYFKMHVNFL